MVVRILDNASISNGMQRASVGSGYRLGVARINVLLVACAALLGGIGVAAWLSVSHRHTEMSPACRSPEIPETAAQVTERFTRAVEQLGHEKRAVRLRSGRAHV